VPTALPEKRDCPKSWCNPSLADTPIWDDADPTLKKRLQIENWPLQIVNCIRGVVDFFNLQLAIVNLQFPKRK